MVAVRQNGWKSRYPADRGVKRCDLADFPAAGIDRVEVRVCKVWREGDRPVRAPRRTPPEWSICKSDDGSAGSRDRSETALCEESDRPAVVGPERIRGAIGTVKRF